VRERFALHRRTPKARRLLQSWCAVLRCGDAPPVEVLDFERDPALDTAALPTSPPGRHFTVANLT
jgi:hypothetical protein